jgi:hypothetical protein
MPHIAPSAERVAFAADGKTVASVGADRTIRVWDVAAGKERCRWSLGNHYASALAFPPDGKVLATGGIGKVSLWDSATGKEILSWQGHRTGSSSILFSPDGETVVSACDYGNEEEVCWWDRVTGKQLRRFRGRLVAISPGGKELALADGKVIHFWDMILGKEVRRLPDSRDRFMCGVLSPGGKMLIRAQGGIPEGTLAAGELGVLWTNLGSENAAKAYRALGRLVGAPKDTLPFLGKHLPYASPTDRRIARLIADLDDDEYAVREKATHELEKLGPVARPALRQVLKAPPSPEVRRRVQGLLPALRPSDEETLSPEQLRALRAIQVIEYIGNPEAKHLLQALAEKAADRRLREESMAALKRLPVGRPGS